MPRSDQKQVRRSVVFTHIPRTAGSTVHATFQAAFLPDWYIADSSARLSSIRAAIGDSTRPVYVGGHFTLDDVDRAGFAFGAPPLTVATVRDPVERILSWYSLILARPSTNPPVRAAMGPNRALEDFLHAAATVAPGMIPPNAQCRKFAPAGTFAAAREAFSRYSFIATPERLDELVSAMSRAVGLGDTVRLGPAINAAPRLPASSSALRMIEESTREDRLLFEYVSRIQGGLLPVPRTPEGP